MPVERVAEERSTGARLAEGSHADEGGPLLAFDDVNVVIGDAPILHGITFEVRAGRTLGIVGESGSGKSMTALAAMRLLPRGSTLSGAIRFDGTDLARLDERSLQSVRGGEIGMIFQEPMTALNPLQTIGAQVAECIRLHGVRANEIAREEASADRPGTPGAPRASSPRAGVRRVGAAEAERLAAATLERAGLDNGAIPPSRYPHELSGGQRQRVVIAIAIACRPKLLIADEPTTALDVTTQAEILVLLRRLQREDGLALVLISHDLAVVADMADDLVVMKDGHVVDAGPFDTVFAATGSAYTRSLIAASTWAPDPTTRRTAGGELLAVDDLVVGYPSGPRRLFGARERFRAVDGVAFRVEAGESVGLVGESGCGKSTLTRALLGLVGIDAGTIRLGGETVATATSPGDRPARGDTVPRALRREIQVVFQDPYGSFDPRHRVERLVAEPLHLLDARPSRAAKRARVAAMLERVGIEPAAMRRYIHEFSGGQRQRIAIARALIVEPSLVVLDEAVSALDVSVRAQVLALLAELARDDGLAYLFISHDLSVVRNVTDRVLVMRAGRIVEAGETARVFAAPAHAYTRELLAAVPALPETSSAS